MKIYEGVAKKLGFDLTAAELKEEIIAQEKARAEMTDQAADSIKKMEMDELDAVAGGGAKAVCMDTYKDKENCWFNDGCDQALNSYGDYKCKNSDKGACILSSNW